jgi:hypothetical protein
MKSLSHYWETYDKTKKSGKETQRERYQRLRASPEIQRIIDIGGGPGMGTRCEDIARYWFSPLLQKRESTGHDHRINIGDSIKKLEQKSSGLWDSQEDSFKWQHIEVDHNWDGLLLAGIYPTYIRYWGLTKLQFKRLLQEGKVTNQGNAEKNSTEGMWMNYKDIKDSLVEIQTNDQLLAFARNC